MRRARLKAIAVTGCTLFSLAIAADATFHVATREGKRPSERAERLYFQPLGDFPPSAVAELTDHFQHRFPPTKGISIAVLPVKPLPPDVRDSSRDLLVADELITLIRRQNPRVAADPHAVIIGLTTGAMYSRKEGTVWAWRREYRFGVISSEMFGPTLVGDTPGAVTARSRLRKMVAKNIAILYFHIEHNNDPDSLLYFRLRSVPQIDRARETF